MYPYMSSKPLNLRGQLKVSVASDHLLSEDILRGRGLFRIILSWTTSQTLNTIKAVSTVEQSPTNLPHGVPDFLKHFPRFLDGMVE